ncbi:MAG: hypothetical protein H6555_06015 [Lewinellaceae bacterium]|nr:hypothetical protein [Lewinellaceae bacterium]
MMLKWSNLALTVFCFFAFAVLLPAQKPGSGKPKTRKVQYPQTGRNYNDTIMPLKEGGLPTQSTSGNARKMQRPQTRRIVEDTVLVKSNPRTGGLQPQSARGNAQNVSNTPGSNDKTSKVSGNQSGTSQGKSINRPPMRNGEMKTGQSQRKKGSQGVRGRNAGGGKAGNGVKRRSN